MTNSIKNKFVSGVLWSLCDKLFTQLGYLAVTLYIAKIIGPESFGLVGMLAIFTLLAESIVSNGFSQALVHKSNSLTESDKSTIFWVNLLWGLGVYLLLYLSAPLIAQFYNQPKLVDIARLLFLIVIVNSLSVVARAQLLIKVDFKSQTIVAAFATVFSSVVAIFLALQGYDYWALVWLLLLKAIFQNFGLWLSSRWRPKLVFSMVAFRSLFRFGSNLMIAGFVATLVNNLYIALVGRYYNASSVGFFTQATNLTNFLSQVIASTLQGVTYPILTSIKEDSDRLISLYQKLIRITMLASLPALVGFAAISEAFVYLFLGSDWMEAVPIIQILCFAKALTPISAINMNILNAVGRSDLFLKVDICKLPITLTTLLISIQFGIQAVALAIFINVFISFFINAYFPGKMFGFGAWAQIRAARNYLFSSFLMFLTIRLVEFHNAWANLFGGIAIGAFLYFLMLIALKDETLKLAWSEVRLRINV